MAVSHQIEVSILSSATAADMRVSLAIPLAGIGVFSAAQLWLGTSPAIVAMAGIATAVPLLPLWLYGRSLYALLGIDCSLRYTGVALAAKTFYGQTLESNLFNPYATYGLTLLFMVVVTAILIIVRKLDHGKTLFPFPMDPRSLRRLSVVCGCIGIASQIAMASSKTLENGAFNGGAMLNIGANLQGLFYLGLIAEASYAISISNGRGFVTPRLALMLFLATIMVIILNVRGMIVDCLIAIGTVAFLYNSLRVRHILIGLAAGVFFISFFTPVTLYLRMAKEGLSRFQFMELAGNTIVKAATDPVFFKLISNTVKSGLEDPKGLAPYDYYGDRANVLNRMSYVGLVDAVYNGTRNREPIGMPALNQTFARVAPGFLGYDKQVSAYGMGDWLCWQTDLLEPGTVTFMIFNLPMEGLAVWGLAGFILYPFIFMLPVLYICCCLSSFRLALPVSIFLFSNIQSMMFESSSDGFLGWLTRYLPLTLSSLFILYKVLNSRARQARSLAAGAFPLGPPGL